MWTHPSLPSISWSWGKNTERQERDSTGVQVEMLVLSHLGCGPPSASLPGAPCGSQQDWDAGAGQLPSSLLPLRSKGPPPP